MIIQPGMLAKSKAGHDKNCIYVIICVNAHDVYLADGRKWTVCHYKRKNRKHIQPIGCVRCESVAENEEIRKAISEFADR